MRGGRKRVTFFFTYCIKHSAQEKNKCHHRQSEQSELRLERQREREREREIHNDTLPICMMDDSKATRSTYQ